MPNVNSKTNQHLGWRRQAPDARDRVLRNDRILAGTLPTSVDLRAALSLIEDQGSLGSCTANMLAAMVEANELKRSVALSPLPTFHPLNQLSVVTPAVTVSDVKTSTDGTITFAVKVAPSVTPAPVPPPPPPPAPKPFVDVSRLFQYYATRKIEGTTTEDSGATIRDTLKASALYGVVDEKLWPYVVSKLTVNPPSTVWTEAAKYKVVNYMSIKDGDLTTMKQALASGYLVGFGFTVYSYFMSNDMATKAVLNRPTSSEFIEGGHAVCLVGYDDAKKAFLVRNSWGPVWGLAGYYWHAYDYVADTSLCNDFWVIEASPI